MQFFYIIVHKLEVTFWIAEISHWRLKPRSHRARRVASTRVDPTTFGLLASNVCIAYSSNCQLRHSQLRHCIVNDFISPGVVWWWSLIATRTFWPFVVIRSPIAYSLNWHRSFDVCKLVDARRRGRCECFLSLALVWLDASTRSDALGVNGALGLQRT